MKESQKIKKELAKEKSSGSVPSTELLSTGSTLLNLQCTGRTIGGFRKGKYHYLVGDSDSGKTFLSLSCLAEASINKNFDNYRFIYDNAEDGADIDIEKFFGKAVAERIEPPAFIDNEAFFSSTVEEFYYWLEHNVKQGPCIYILDSMDSLSSKQEQEEIEAGKKAYEAGKEEGGSYGDAKAKVNSRKLRNAKRKLRTNGSILIIVSQTRDDIGSRYKQKTRSGGHALHFYTPLEIWSSPTGNITKEVGGQPRQVGITCKLQIKKNHFTGKKGSVEIPIYHSYGIDDIGSCVDYLMDERHWKKIKGSIEATEFGVTCTREKLIRTIEQNKQQKELRSIVGKVWNDIQAALELNRDKRY